MSSDSNDSELFHFKGDGTGVELSVSKGLPNLFYRLLPRRFRARRDTEQAIVESLLRKIRENGRFDDAEAYIAESLIGEPIAKFIRLKRIESRAEELLKALPPRTDASAAAEDPVSKPPATSDDWVNKFREDASLVDDEVVREIYSSILVNESVRPGSFSLRTLSVLRYLDSGTAESFGKLQQVVLNGSSVPGQDSKKHTVFQKAGLMHAELLDMDDVGLVNAKTDSIFSNIDTQHSISLLSHKKVVGLWYSDEREFTLNFECHALTRAGTELSLISQVEPDDVVFKELLRWIRSQSPGPDICVATLPHPDWKGPLNSVSWQPVTNL